MAYNIRLFVHGVPNGQDIWGSLGEDEKYIKAFYGRKSNVPSQMILEVMRFGGELYAYYTYFYYHSNIQDSANRPGGYFALTLRINYYYADIQNVYNLLEAAFNKFVLGSVMQYTTGGGCRFLVSQFSQAEDNFKALEKELQHYLMQFSSNEDFVSLNGFSSNGQDDCGTINLLEATPVVVEKHVRSTGKISVSSLFPSSREQQIIKGKDAEVQTVKSNAQQQIEAVQKKAQQDVHSAQIDKEQCIQSIRNEYKEADKTISQLRAQKDKADKEISRLSAQLNELNVKLQTAQTYRARYEECEKRLEKTEKLIVEIKKNLSGLSGISELLEGAPSPGGNRRAEDKAKGVMSFIRKIHPLIDFLVMLILLGIIGVTLPKSCGSKELSTQNITFVDNDKKSEQETTTEQKGENTTKSIPDESCTGEVTLAENNIFQDSIASLRKRFHKARIDVTGIDESNGIYMEVNSKAAHILSVQRSIKGLKVEWVCDTADFELRGDTIIPKRPGLHTVACEIGGVKYLYKNITVK